jgi:hypothetical protein
VHAVAKQQQQVRDERAVLGGAHVAPLDDAGRELERRRRPGYAGHGEKLAQIVFC